MGQLARRVLGGQRRQASLHANRRGGAGVQASSQRCRAEGVSRRSHQQRHPTVYERLTMTYRDYSSRGVARVRLPEQSTRAASPVGRLRPWMRPEREALGELLLTFPWSIFCTWSFRDRIGEEGAIREV